MAIMRSRKPSPGSLVTRTTSQSDSTRVPPVTEEKSLPDSRSTGADSPVTALSFTEATPTTTSPSAGMISCASTSTKSPLRRLLADTSSKLALRSAERSFFAWTSLRMARRDAAWAFPRPSATASAKLANRTVSQSHAAMASTNPGDPASAMVPVRVPIPRMVVTILPTNTMNITGLRTWTRGSSLRKASSRPARTMGPDSNVARGGGAPGRPV